MSKSNKAKSAKEKSKSKPTKIFDILSSSSLSSKSPNIILENDPKVDSDSQGTDDPDTLKANLDHIKEILEIQVENSNHLENILPAKYLKYDPSCIRKYSNFSFPKENKFFYDFVDYFPSKNEREAKDIDTTPKVKEYLRSLHNETMYADFLDTLKLVSPKALTLINKIHELDAKDMAQYGKKFKHFIFSDAKSSMGGVKFLASVLIASGMNLGYTAEPKLGKKNWSKMELLSNAQLERTKFNNFFMLCSKSVYDEPITVATKKEILARFNERPDNVYGDNIRIILMDGGYKEGIDLFDIKYVHIFEPTLTQADQKQVIGRGTRTCGQKGLDFHPLKGWPLYVYIYDLKMEEPFDKLLNATSGIEMYFNAMNLNIKLLNFTNELETMCVQNAVDFELNQNIHSFSIAFDGEQGESLRGGAKSGSSSSGSSSSGSSSSGSSSSGSTGTSKTGSSSSGSTGTSKSGSKSSRSKSGSSSSRSSSRSKSLSSSRSSSTKSSSRSKSSSSSRSSSSSTVVSSHSSTASLNEEFFRKGLSKSSSSTSSSSTGSSSSIDYSIDKPLNAIQMRQYIRDYFSQYAWDPVVMENNCVPKKGGNQQKGGATIMTYTPTQAFVSNFFTPSNPLKGMLLWHSVGTGKTCTAIATATSTFEKQGYTILWVTRTTLKNDIWKNMFDQVCHDIIKLRIENEGIVIPSNNTDRMKLLSKSWRVRPMSYKQFSNLVSKKNQIYETMVKINGNEDPLRKTLLVIDEAHKLYGGGDLSSIETPDMVALHASLMNSYIMSGENSVKLLLMTATPIQTDPMELIKLVNLFKMPTEQMPNNFDVFSEEYLDNNGIFKPEGLHKFRNQIAGHISYLNREKDARQFSQPVVSLIQTDIYDNEILKYNKKATQKLYSVMGKEIDNNLKALKANPINKAKIPEGFDTLKKICDNYEYKKSKTVCKKIISGYKKESAKNLKEKKAVLKQQLTEYKKVVSDFKEQKKNDIDNATTNENESPLMFRSGRHRVPLRKIESVFSRLNNCSKSITNTDKLLNSAIANNPDIAQIKNKIAMYKQHISENSLILKKEKNPETKEMLKELIVKDNKKLQGKSKKLKQKIKAFTKVVKKKLNQTKKNVRVTQSKQKKLISTLKRLKMYDVEFEDKELEIKITDDIRGAVEGIELKLKEKEDKKQAKTMKKMEKEQAKLQKEDLKKAKQHAKTMKIMERQKAKEDKEFTKQQKARDAEFKKLDAAAKKQEKELDKQREKEAREANAAREKREKELNIEAKKREKELEKAAKEANAAREKRERELDKERQKQQEKAAKEARAIAEREAKAEEKQREKDAKVLAKAEAKDAAKKTKKNVKGGKRTNKKTRRNRN
jgi:hypothetical protein